MEEIRDALRELVQKVSWGSAYWLILKNDLESWIDANDRKPR